MKQRLAFVLVVSTLMVVFALPAEAQYGGYLTINTPTSGVFHPGLPIDARGKPFVDYQFVVSAPGTYQINLTSSDTSSYDPYIVLLLNGIEIARDDDGAGALNSRLVRFLQPGQYTIRVTRFGSGPVSRPVAFTLSATSSVGVGGPVVHPYRPHHRHHRGRGQGRGNALTDAAARVLITQFYNTRSRWAGQYAVTIAQTRLVVTGPRTAEIHARYHYTCVRRHCRGGRSGVDQRVFFLRRRGPQWQVIRMGGHMSGRL